MPSRRGNLPTVSTVASVVRPGVVVMRRSLGASLRRLEGGLFGSSPRLRRQHVPGLRSVIFWTFPQSSQSLSAACSTASPTPEYSTTAFQVPRGGSTPPSYSLPLVPTPGVRLRSVPVRLVRLSILPTLS